jgi:hypothetical protein
MILLPVGSRFGRHPHLRGAETGQVLADHLPQPEPRPREPQRPRRDAEAPGNGGEGVERRRHHNRVGHGVQLPAGLEADRVHQPETSLLPEPRLQTYLFGVERKIHVERVRPDGEFRRRRFASKRSLSVIVAVDRDPSPTEGTDRRPRHHQQAQRRAATGFGGVARLHPVGAPESGGERRFARRHHHCGGVRRLLVVHDRAGGDQDQGGASQELVGGGAG